MTFRGGLQAAAYALVIMAKAPLAGGPSDSATTTVDHVILGVADLDRGIAELTRLTGVAPVFGGRHPGRGTQNALLSLGGGTYLELLAPSDEADEKTRSRHAAFTRPTPVGWAIGTTDLDQLARRLGGRGIRTSEARDGSRVRPDGSALKWRTAEPIGLDEDLKPFFIQWSRETVHPSKTSPDGCRLESLAAIHPTPQRLQGLVEALGLPVRVRQGFTGRAASGPDLPGRPGRAREPRVLNGRSLG